MIIEMNEHAAQTVGVVVGFLTLAFVVWEVNDCPWPRGKDR